MVRNFDYSMIFVPNPNLCIDETRDVMAVHRL